MTHIIAFALMATSFFGGGQDACCKDQTRATCVPLGQGICHACKNCKYCKHCKAGGVCSVCAKEKAHAKQRKQNR